MYVLMCRGVESRAREVLEKAHEDGVFSVIGPFETIEEARQYEKEQLIETNVCPEKHLVVCLSRP